MNAIVTELLEQCRAADLALSVEGDMLCIDWNREPPPALIDELRRHKPEIMAALAAMRPTVIAMRPNVIAPAPWVEQAAGAGDTPFEERCLDRRGVVERTGGAFLHFCVECGRWGAYGYGVTGDNPGRWYCREHRPDDCELAPHRVSDGRSQG
jgi:hypothetical protein